MTDRGERKLATLKAVARHHGRPEDSCWRCGRTDAHLERAHLVDRMQDGLDGPQNLALLCPSCHAMMPPYCPDDADDARGYAIPEQPSLALLVENACRAAGFTIDDLVAASEQQYGTGRTGPPAA
jgi:5-methylcytosine-specific restriction endonuclease McrA